MYLFALNMPITPRVRERRNFLPISDGSTGDWGCDHESNDESVDDRGLKKNEGDDECC
jgi:hypothetical protein